MLTRQLRRSRQHHENLIMPWEPISSGLGTSRLLSTSPFHSLTGL